MTFGKIGARRMMWSINNLLPKGARWVEYLENSGAEYYNSAWIDTGVVPNFNTSLKIEVIPKANYGWIFGSRNDAANPVVDRFCLFYDQFGNIYYQFDALTQNAVFRIQENIKYNINLSVNGLTINDRFFTLGATPSQFQGVYPISLFNIRASQSAPTNNPFSGKITMCDIYDAQSPIRKFRPIAIGTTGYMMDILTGDYLQYGNHGTGSFIIGPDAQPPTI